MPADSPKPHSIQNPPKTSPPIHLPVMQPEAQHPRLWPRPLTLVGQFTGDHPPSLPTLESLIPTLWAPRQRVVVGVVSPLADNLFVFLFSNATDFIRVEAGAPWPVDGHHHLLLKKWHPGIDPSHFFITSVPVWMTIWPFLPEFLNPTMVFKIAKTAGDIIDVDHRTLDRKELRFARVCIQLDWSKPVPPGVSVRCEGTLHWVFFDYERIPTVCLRCGVVGHEFWRCRRGVVGGGDSVMDRAERVIEVMSRRLPRYRYNNVAADERQLESANRRGYQRNSIELPWFVWLSSVKGLREWRSRFEAAEDGEGDDDMLTSSQVSDDDVERE